MSKSRKSKAPESYGPKVMLAGLEQQGLGDGPLASSLRQHLADPQPGGIVIRSTMRGRYEDQIQRMRTSLARIETYCAECESRLVKAIEAGLSCALDPEILWQIEDARRDRRLATA